MALEARTNAPADLLEEKRGGVKLALGVIALQHLSLSLMREGERVEIGHLI